MRNSLRIALCAALLSGGCATPALWGIKSCAPASNPKLSLAFAPERHDILVQYSETAGFSAMTRKKSYWLFAYSDSSLKDRTPQFIETTNLPALVNIPVVDWEYPLPRNGYGARLVGPGTFDLYHDCIDLGRFQLPTYFTHAEHATVSRVILTPPAVLADTLIVGSITAVYLSPYALEALASRH